MNPHKTWWSRLVATLVWAFAAFVFAMTGWSYGIKPLSTATSNWLTARDYQETPASVVQRTGQDAEGSFTWYSARYDAGGQARQTARMTVLEDEAIDEPSNALAQKDMQKALAENKPISVWVSPRDADVALVSRDLPLRSLLGRLPMAIGFSIFVLAGVAGAFGALFNFKYYARQWEAAFFWGFAALWCGFIFPIFNLFAGKNDNEWVALLFVGIFALVGVGIIWAAIATTINGQGVAQTGSRSKLPASSLATSWGPKGRPSKPGKPVKGAVKRGGMGGRGDDYDKD